MLDQGLALEHDLVVRVAAAAAAGSLLEQVPALEQDMAMEQNLAMEQDLTAGRYVWYGFVVLHVEEEEKVAVELETMASAMVASAAEGGEVRSCALEQVRGGGGGGGRGGGVQGGVC